jgi:hypothetical protein
VLLTQIRGQWLCYAHQLGRRGGRVYEDHHVLPRRLDSKTVVRVPANDHRLLEEMKRDWPDEILKNPTNAPFLRLAGEALSRADLAHLTERQARQEAAYLVDCHRCFVQRDGVRYWEQTNHPRLEDYATDGQND